MKKLAPLSLIILFITGCATAEQWAPPINYGNNFLGECPSDKACIYVIRPAGILGGVMHFVIVDNNNAVGMTGPRSYLSWQRYPGEVNLSTESENNAEVHFIAQAGKTYYILQSLAMGLMEARSNFNFITEDQALKYLKFCHPASGM
jgi:hypothetical protein